MKFIINQGGGSRYYLKIKYGIFEKWNLLSIQQNVFFKLQMELFLIKETHEPYLVLKAVCKCLNAPVHPFHNKSLWSFFFNCVCCVQWIGPKLLFYFVLYCIVFLFL